MVDLFIVLCMFTRGYTAKYVLSIADPYDAQPPSAGSAGSALRPVVALSFPWGKQGGKKHQTMGKPYRKPFLLPSGKLT